MANQTHIRKGSDSPLAADQLMVRICMALKDRIGAKYVRWERSGNTVSFLAGRKIVGVLEGNEVTIITVKQAIQVDVGELTRPRKGNRWQRKTPQNRRQEGMANSRQRCEAIRKEYGPIVDSFTSKRDLVTDYVKNAEIPMLLRFASVATNTVFIPQEDRLVSVAVGKNRAERLAQELQRKPRVRRAEPSEEIAFAISDQRGNNRRISRERVRYHRNMATVEQPRPEEEEHLSLNISCAKFSQKADYRSPMGNIMYPAVCNLMQIRDEELARISNAQKAEDMRLATQQEKRYEILYNLEDEQDLPEFSEVAHSPRRGKAKVRRHSDAKASGMGQARVFDPVDIIQSVRKSRKGQAKDLIASIDASEWCQCEDKCTCPDTPYQDSLPNTAEIVRVCAGMDDAGLRALYRQIKPRGDDYSRLAAQIVKSQIGF